MPELTEAVDVDAPPERVWGALTDWVRQGEWMLATDVRTVGGPAQEVGGRLEARTGIPVRDRRLGVLDAMEVTRWEPPRRVDVRHVGRVVRGSGVFEVRPRGPYSTFVWTEVLDLPLGALGRLGSPW
jgi:Polyketide cyclase / dehydrase and lipid transport